MGEKVQGISNINGRYKIVLGSIPPGFRDCSLINRE